MLWFSGCLIHLSWLLGEPQLTVGHGLWAALSMDIQRESKVKMPNSNYCYCGQRAQEVDGVIVQASSLLQSCTQETIADHPYESCHK